MAPASAEPKTRQGSAGMPATAASDKPEVCGDAEMRLNEEEQELLDRVLRSSLLRHRQEQQLRKEAEYEDRHRQPGNREAQELLDKIFGRLAPCAHIANPPHSVAEALRRQLVPVEFLADAFKVLGQIETDYSPCPHSSIPATRDDVPPSWDNVVRAYEEDR
jgi:hypothetical protein